MAGMYPDNKTLSVFGKEVSWPGLSGGKFSSGSFEDPLVPPTFIPAETLNLVLDNLGELVAELGGTPDNKNPKQVAAAVKGALAALEAATEANLALKAPVESPVFTGTPKVPNKTGAATAGGTLVATEAQVCLKADRASPALTGTPTAPAPDVSDSGTRIATTAFTHAAAKNDAWPTGSYYTQYPLTGQSTIANMFPPSGSPATLFGGTWTEMYAGENVFFMGGLSSVESNRSSGIQEDAIRDITASIGDPGYDNITTNFNPKGAFYSSLAYSSWRVMGTTVSNAATLYFDASRAVPIDSTNHPKNRPIKVWRRTA